ncbi:MAG TPA: GlxA family transcriptional regulator [Pyrinomonadaceae bacterium]|nr:GlxA family transcriptional regulator [Pyrinomonadaceae bacterium]
MPKSRSNASLVKRRRIVIVVVPPIEEMDLVAPLQVFSAANRLSERKIYSLEIATNGRALEVPGEGGMLCFLAQRRIQEVKGSIDSVLLVCGVGTRLLRDRELSQWLKTIAPAVRRLGGVCVGSFLLAEAGLLNGKKATSHWRFGKELAKRYPQVQVESEPIWVRDGNIYTSAGISAGIDLALAWVEEDGGSALAHEVAREFVLFLRRPGGQEQLSVSLAKQASDMRSIQELQVWIADHVDANLSVQALAEHVAMSVRNFERVFSREIGCTPARYVAQVRVEAARRALEDTDKSIEQIARNCGFVSADLMRRAFTRCIGITPARYRTDRFSRKGANAQTKSFETR